VPVLVLTIMAVAAVLAAALLATSIQRARACGDLDASTGLILGMAGLISLPAAVAVATGEYQRRPDEFRQLVAVLPGWYPAATRLALGAVAALAVLLLLRRLATGRVVLGAAGLMAVCLWAVAQLAGSLHGGQSTSLHALVLLTCLLPATILPRGRGACLGAAIFGVVLAIAGGALAVVHPDRAFVIPCEGACSGLGFRGVFPNDSLMGVALAVSVPFAYLGFRGKARVWLTLYLAGMALATGSRTAIGAVAVTLLVLLLVRPRLVAAPIPSGRAAVAAVFMVAAAIAAAYIPQHDWPQTFLTGRPLLWEVASGYIERSPLVGYGPARWETLTDLSEIPRAGERSAHNQWLDVLFAAGVVGAGLLVALFVAAVRSAGPAWPAVGVTLGALLTIGATEGLWSIGRVDFLSFSLVAVILMGPGPRPPPATG
jgi:O-antigen ligase